MGRRRGRVPSRIIPRGARRRLGRLASPPHPRREDRGGRGGKVLRWCPDWRICHLGTKYNNEFQAEIWCASSPTQRFARAMACTARGVAVAPGLRAPERPVFDRGSARGVAGSERARVPRRSCRSEILSSSREPRGASARASATGGEAPPKPARTVGEDPPAPDDESSARRDASPASTTAPDGAEDGVASGSDCARAVRELPFPTLSTSDARFDEKLGVAFRWGPRPDHDLDELNDLFASVGFPRRDPARLRRALEHSHEICWVVVATKKSQSTSVFVGQVIGFARATSDGVFNATIWDVVVSPSWQGCGIGRGMVERLVDRLLRADIANVSLFAEPAVVGLYRSAGFEEDPGGTTGMAFRHAASSRRTRGGANPANPANPVGGSIAPDAISERKPKAAEDPEEGGTRRSGPER